MHKPGLRSWILASTLALHASGCMTLLEPIEQRFLYRPRPADAQYLATLAASADGIEEVRMKAPDGVPLHGWLARPRDARAGTRFPLVIVFGGVRREVSWIMQRHEGPKDWGWLFVNYRGYGLSGGEPSESALLDDARLVYDWAAARADVDASRIALLGRSLGAYYAVAVAAARPARAVILATPFDSIGAIGARRYPLLPLGWLLNAHYNPASLAPTVRVPALFVLAENDDVTPVESGERLARGWGGPVRKITLPGARHYGIERRDDFWQAVGDFLGSLKAGPVGAVRLN